MPVADRIEKSRAKAKNSFLDGATVFHNANIFLKNHFNSSKLVQL